MYVGVLEQYSKVKIINISICEQILEDQHIWCNKTNI